MKAFLRALIRSRASQRCEYCHMHESDLPLFPFHVEHIVPRKHGGGDEPLNLAWSCHECNFAKSSNLSGRDVVTRRIVVLYNPRRQRWKRHFKYIGARLVGLTPCGRATIAVLNINDPERIALRESLVSAGLFPPV